MEYTIIRPEQNFMSRIEIILPEPQSRLRGASWEEYYLIPISREQREFWPPYKINFQLQTDVGTIHTWVVGASARPGDPLAGSYITRGLHPWFRNHPELCPGKILEARKLENLVYSLSVLSTENNSADEENYC